MKIAVILCTYNRCERLGKALSSVAGSILPGGVEWEVLLIDNNSSDLTRDVVNDYCERYPGRFRYVFEPTPGKSHALNTGLRESSADILAFMDDDVTVEPMWLQNLTRPLFGNEWVGAGGRILPEWPCKPPDWLSLDGPYALVGILALFDLGLQPGQLNRAPFGTNMAFQKRIFEKYGGFRTDLGPRPGSEIRNEDIEFCNRLLAAGERLWYEPSAVVYHAIPENRLKKDYFTAFWFDHGRATVREMGPRPDLWGIPRHYLTILKMASLLVGMTLRWLLTPGRQKRFYYKLWVWMTAGHVVEWYRKCAEGIRRTEPSNART
jgi:glucosyl-dolichyl phosphate glucuronosyltransferase